MSDTESSSESSSRSQSPAPDTTSANPDYRLRKADKDAAETLHRLFKKESQQINALFTADDKSRLLQDLQKIIDLDITEVTTDPEVYCIYEQDNRAGYFAADAVVPLSTYIANLVCNTKFYYCDVLGKHSELDFTIHDVDMTIGSVPGEFKQDEEYELEMEDPRIQIDDDSVFHEVRDKLQEHMKSLEPIKASEFKDKRYDELVEFAENLYNEQTKTNDPIILLKKTFNNNNRSFFSDRKEDIRTRIRLSEVCALLLMKYEVDSRYEWNKDRMDHSDEIFPVSSMQMSQVDEKIYHCRYIPWDKEDFRKVFDEHKAIAKKVLDEYKPEDPGEFFDNHFEEIKRKLNITVPAYPVG